MTGVQEVFAGLNNFQAIKTDGSLWVWGSAYDRLGMSETDKSVPLKVMDDAKYCEIGSYTTYAVKKDGSIWGFGYNVLGILGETKVNSVSLEDMELITTPVKIADDSLPQIGEAIAGHHLYFLKKDNSLSTISSKSVYESLAGDTYETYSNTLDKVMDNVDYFETSNGSTFIAQKDGTLWMLSEVSSLGNDYAQFGDGTADTKFNPVALTNISNFDEARDIIGGAVFTLPEEPSRLDIDNFLRYAEEGISAYAKAKAADGNISNDLVEEQKTKIREIKEVITHYAESVGRQYYRDLEEGVSIVIDDGAINIEPSALQADIDNINIIGNGFGIVIEPKKIGEELSEEESLQISAEPIAVNKYKIEINRDALGRPIKVQVPVKNGMVPARLYVTDTDGNTVPSLFNAANGKLEFKISSSGTYTVLENLTTFTDIENSDLGVQLSAYYLALKGVMPGTDETKFSPNEPITRGEAVTLITKALGVYDAEANGGFEDVEEPDKVIQKSELAAICVNALNFQFNYQVPEQPEMYLASFADREVIPEWAEPYVATAVRDGIFGIDPGEEFNSEEALTRGEFAKIFNRLYKLSW